MLFAIALYLATIYIRPAEILPALAGVPVAEFAAAFSVLVAVISYVRDPRPLADRPADRYLLGFWIAIVVSNLAWGWMTGAWKGLTEFFTAVFSYWLVRLGARSERQVRVVITLLVAFSLFQALNGILQYHTGIGFGATTMVEDHRIRGTGIFNDPNDLGMVLVMVIPFVLSAVLEGAMSSRALALVALAPILTAIYYTNSRGAVLGVAATICAYVRSRYRGLLAPALIGLAIVAVVSAAPSRAAELSSQEESAHGRIEAWSEGLMMLKSHPLFGVGYGRFTEFNELVAHNSFVHTFAELGIAGAFCLMGMWVSYFRGLRPVESDAISTSSERLRRDLVASAVGTLTCAMFLSRQYVVIPYLLLALGTAHGRLIEATGSIEPRRAPVPYIVAATIGGIVLTRIVVLVLLHA